VNIEKTDVRAMLENIDGGAPQPIIDFATVDVRRLALAPDPFSRRRLGGYGDLRAAPEEMYGFYFARADFTPRSAAR
jgi:hypothetical protein